MNNKKYIGQTNNPQLRWSQHKSNAKYNKGNQIITRALSKYGSEKFSFEIIATCQTQEDADFTEEEIIKQYDSRNLEVGYNLDSGGNTSPRTPEVLKKISDSLNKYYETHDGWLKGGKLTEEWKNNISKASIGKPGTNKGKTFSDEWKKKISKSNAGKERKSNRRFSEEVEKEICRLYSEENMPAYKLGKKFDCYRTLITDILVRNNIDIRKSNYNNRSFNKKFSNEDEMNICNFYLNLNKTMTNLSKEFKCSKATIREILLRNNVDLKNGKAGKVKKS